MCVFVVVFTLLLCSLSQFSQTNLRSRLKWFNLGNLNNVLFRAPLIFSRSVRRYRVKSLY